VHRAALGGDRSIHELAHLRCRFWIKQPRGSRHAVRQGDKAEGSSVPLCSLAIGDCIRVKVFTEVPCEPVEPIDVEHAGGFNKALTRRKQRISCDALGRFAQPGADGLEGCGAVDTGTDGANCGPEVGRCRLESAALPRRDELRRDDLRRHEQTPGVDRGDHISSGFSGGHAHQFFDGAVPEPLGKPRVA
jgi:hypothetical protein